MLIASRNYIQFNTAVKLFTRGEEINMQRSRQILGVIVFGLALPSVSLCGTLPAAFFSLQTQTQANIYGDSGVPGQTLLGSPGTISVEIPKNGGALTSDVVASIGTGDGATPDTTLNSTAYYLQTPGASGHYPFAEATAELVYAVMVNGPAGGTGLVDINFSAKAGGSSGVAESYVGYYIEAISADANISIDSNTGAVTVTGGETGDLFDNGEFGQLTMDQNTPIQLGTSSLDETVGGAVGSYFLLALSVDAAVYSDYPISDGFPPPASAYAMIDPTFAIDPSTFDASAYSLSYSPGIQPAPEPGSSVIVMIGLAGMLLRKRT